MFYQFRYEKDLFSNLDRLPLHVRMKLDLTGIKLSLKQWLAFHIEERAAICHLPVDGEDEKRAFKDYLSFLSRQYCGASALELSPMKPLWDVSDQVPAPVLERSGDNGDPVTLEEWIGWASHQRYALYKTAVSKSEPEKFFAVLDELRQTEG